MSIFHDRKPLKIIKLKTSDGKIFEIDINLAKRFGTLKTLIEDSELDDNNPVCLNNISGNVMEKIIEYSLHHFNDPPIPEDISIRERRKSFDRNFITSIDTDLIFELIVAANFLDERSLFDLACKSIANIIKYKTVDEIRSYFNIKNDFTHAEEELLKQENSWAEKTQLFF
ncbi:hypothetical protein RND71_044112 [Anisodus tanguticus]|uniref:SKP1-like protein n=1 Tax=Anisodus tanguticus TaxID=243964 RepID=A0AAE1UQY4_9SOLA|nr:hypothetical protein RND71_044112 [Anisodus tanguticus]